MKVGCELKAVAGLSILNVLPRHRFSVVLASDKNTSVVYSVREQSLICKPGEPTAV